MSYKTGNQQINKHQEQQTLKCKKMIKCLWFKNTNFKKIKYEIYYVVNP